MKTMIAIDLETTGTDPSADRIIEVGAVKFDESGAILDRFQSFVNPGRPIPSLISNLTGITDADVRNAPSFEDLRHSLNEFIDDVPLVGHNIDFDLAFLRAVDVSIRIATFDTWMLATILLPHLPSHSLEVLVRELKITVVQAHRALNDAESTMVLFLKLRALISKIPSESASAIRAALSGQNWDLAELFSIPRKKKKFSIDALISAEEQPDLASDEGVNFSITSIEDHFSRLANDTTPPFRHIELREGQVKMASIIATALEHGEFHLIEAGPGLGKSFAYLLPAIQYARARDERVVISTYTNALQDQLFRQDVPLLRQFLPFSFRASVLKGRGHYLCTKRFEEFVCERHTDRFALSLLVKLLLWIRTTKDGDTSTLRLLRDEQRILWTLVASPSNCRGIHCEGGAGHTCFYRRARDRAKSSDLVIVNHALLLAERGRGETLEYDHLIVDEAHHLEDALTAHLSASCRFRDIDEEVRAFERWYERVRERRIARRTSRALDDAVAAMRAFREQSVLFFGLVQLFFQNEQRQGRRKESTLTIDADVALSVEWKNIGRAFETLTLKFDRAVRMMDDVQLSSLPRDAKREQPKAPSKGKARAAMDMGTWCRIHDRLVAHCSTLARFMGDEHDEGTVFWLEQRVHPHEDVVFHTAPLDVDREFHDEVIHHIHSCVMTSATLTVAGEFDYIRRRLDLDSSWKEHTIPSPYDYASCVSAIIPSDIALPNDPHYAKQLHALILDAAESFGGRMLVLFASFDALNQAFRALQKPLMKSGLSLFAQRMSGGSGKIVEMFRAHPRSVLFGTRSFWEGIDLAGCRLSCVFITKLPFPVPSDPLLQARGETMDDSFMELFVPQALLTFRQGFGRLIRRSTDHGVIMIADRRVVSSSYGIHFIQSLPSIGLQNVPCADIRRHLDDYVARCG